MKIDNINRWSFETEAIEKGYRQIAGVDEVGRGPLAGPVISAAVILPESFPISQINDSKKLSPKKRNYFYKKIYECAITIGIGIIDAYEIDRINILQASLLSMAIAVKNLSPQPDYLLIDGIFPIRINIPQKAVPHGDMLSASIAAASIVAKITRDNIMDRYHDEFGQFGFSKHKGYPTKEHKDAIRKYNPCPIHRLSFKGVK